MKKTIFDRMEKGIIVAMLMVAAGLMTATIAWASSEICSQFSKESPVERMDSEGKVWNGMAFDPSYAVEAYEYDDAFAIRYTNPDQNMWDVEILVDRETYILCCDSWYSEGDYFGVLIERADMSEPGKVVYHFALSDDCVPEFDF